MRLLLSRLKIMRKLPTRCAAAFVRLLLSSATQFGVVIRKQAAAFVRLLLSSIAAPENISPEKGSRLRAAAAEQLVSALQH